MQNYKSLQVQTTRSATGPVKDRIWDGNTDQQGSKAGHLGCELVVSNAIGLHPGRAAQAPAMEEGTCGFNCR